ncbi:metalloregulator ArsR/SmtB family transcription factor [Bacillus cereus group sp. Bc222]|uniref:ArsR/SmtB family transcription factor n=1 Tax=Bacillus cereus group sp. Bc222 TaxID=3018111 RepID=UPI0022E8CFE0|nr:metalloregulator ArsR/SmtB family transcription factor [Bacillus cereus group sp. Bc222]MDA2241135.1 metalloregulator ArsR/SmtB family transcription factor [Bacillus cereus group sp. Bc222]
MIANFETDAKHYERIAEILRALRHPVRLVIVRELIARGPFRVSELCWSLGMSQSTVSQHLSKLKVTKVVSYERKGTAVYYKVEDEKFIKLIEILGLTHTAC